MSPFNITVPAWFGILIKAWLWFKMFAVLVFRAAQFEPKLVRSWAHLWCQPGCQLSQKHHWFPLQSRPWCDSSTFFHGPHQCPCNGALRGCFQSLSRCCVQFGYAPNCSSIKENHHRLLGASTWTPHRMLRLLILQQVQLGWWVYLKYKNEILGSCCCFLLKTNKCIMD